MSVINASGSDKAINLSTFTDQFDFQVQDPGGNNTATQYSWLTSGNHDIQTRGTGMDFTDPSPDFGNVEEIDVDIDNDDFNDPDVTIRNITGLNGAGLIAPARLGVMVDGIQEFFDEVMSFDDNVTGSGFNDILKAGGGDDTIFGGAGNDSLNGEAGDDSLSGSNGNDTLVGGTGADTMNGGDQDDDYFVDNVGDVAAESFNDAIGGVDTVFATATHGPLGFGIEHLTQQGSGNINGTGNGNANIMTGNSGNNVLSGGANNDTVNGGGGNDTLNGDVGNDVMSGGIGSDVMNGGTGNDVANGNDGNDAVSGNDGNDVLSGGNGNDSVNGDAGDDNVNGDAGNDQLTGGQGVDALNGGTGNDTLTGGPGGDALTGGAGFDVFDFNAFTESGQQVPAPAAPPFATRDVINGFDNPGGGAGDLIDVSTIDAVAGAGGNQTFTFLGVIQNPFPAQVGAGSLYLRNEGGETIVYGNIDGDFPPELAIRIADGAVTPFAYSAADFDL
jgi:Ca2+-binding RTX toxin-like protein